ncbi:choice-of-anchor Q domain-containing protein [Planctomycetota bacterium]
MRTAKLLNNLERLETRNLLAVLTVSNGNDAEVNGFGDAPGTLRQAIFDSNETPGDDVIQFAAGVDLISLENLELVLRDNVAIRGNESPVVIRGDDTSRLFKVDENVNAEFADLVLENGRGAVESSGKLTFDGVVARNNHRASRGGAVYGLMGEISINNSWFSENSSSGGGAIYAGNSVQLLRVTDSHIENNEARSTAGGGGIHTSAESTQIASTTIHGNRAGEGAGGILIDSDAGPVVISSSTISENTSGFAEGAIHAQNSRLRIEHSTIFENEGGVILPSSTILELDHTIVADNLADNRRIDLKIADSSSVDAVFSLVGANGDSGLEVGSPDAKGNLIGSSNSPISPLLSRLANAGSKSRVHIPAAGSPVLNAGNADVDGFPSSDQRGGFFARIADGRIDIGAVERQTAIAQNYLVDTLADEYDGDYSVGHLSLREAIGQANVAPSGTAEIRFAPTLAGGTIHLQQGQLSITENVDIVGFNDYMTVDAGRKSRVFAIDDGDFAQNKTVSLSGLRITNGYVDDRPRGDGGGVYSVEQLRLSNSEVVNNRASVDGNGMFLGSISGGTTTISQTVVSGNSSNVEPGFLVGAGAGIYGIAVGGGEIFVSDSVINGNISAGYAIDFYAGADSQVAIVDTSISGNSEGGAKVEGDGGYVLIDNVNVTENAGAGLLLVAWPAGQIDVLNSTIANNRNDEFEFANGGGIDASAVGTTINIRESTISGNFASNAGAGIYFRGTNSGVLNIVGSTITDNVGNVIRSDDSNAGGIAISDHIRTSVEVMMDRTIVAGNARYGENDELVPSDLNTRDMLTAKHSLIGSNGGSALQAAPADNPDAEGNIIGSEDAPIDPRLGPLGFHGGRTMTHLLLDDSPAIDTGGSTPGNEFDQRGEPYTRKARTSVDIGAAEFGTGVIYGDMNSDQTVDGVDVDQLCSALRTGEFNLPIQDLNYDRTINNDDVDTLLGRIMGTVRGDVNFDGIFNSTDFVQIFRVGEFEDSISNNSTYTEGDWNCDGDFTTRDFVLVFQLKSYTAAARKADHFTNQAAYAAARVTFDHIDVGYGSHYDSKRNSRRKSSSDDRLLAELLRFLQNS